MFEILRAVALVMWDWTRELSGTTEGILLIILIIISPFLIYQICAPIRKNMDVMTGPEFERYCAELLSKNGFKQVKVMGGSGDQGADILAVKMGKKYCVQCKRYQKALSNKPVQEAFTGAKIYHCQVAVVMTNSTFTKGAKEAASKTGVLLWDRAKLLRMGAKPDF